MGFIGLRVLMEAYQLLSCSIVYSVPMSQLQYGSFRKWRDPPIRTPKYYAPYYCHSQVVPLILGNPYIIIILSFALRSIIRQISRVLRYSSHLILQVLGRFSKLGVRGR